MSCIANLYILFTNIKNIQCSEVRKNMECKAAKVDHVTVQIMTNMNIKIEAQPTVILGMDTNEKSYLLHFCFLNLLRFEISFLAKSQEKQNSKSQGNKSFTSPSHSPDYHKWIKMCPLCQVFSWASLSRSKHCCGWNSYPTEVSGNTAITINGKLHSVSRNYGRI